MRKFNRNDCDLYAGAVPFRDGEEPMIHNLDSGLDLIADGSGVTLSGYVATTSIFYRLHESRNHIHRNITLVAHEWIEELEPLNKHEQIALLHHIGIKCITG